jgi:HSP20 family protein
VNTHPKGPAADRVSLPLGLDGLFRGLAQVLQLAHHIAESVPEDASGAVEAGQTGSAGIPKVAQAVYGVSMRIGPRVAPPRRRIATLRRNSRDESVVDDVREPTADVLDEGDHFLVVVELPGVQEDQVQWSLRDQRTLTIRAASPDRNYQRDIGFNEPVDDRDARSTFATGVLELRLWKRRSR